ncbi:MAG: aldose 1-epimerase [Planctomycetota bacterium]|nr:aldose 1-epimerase [Planctomycetota bacterium]MDA1213468.1 aldose 1-epimerase [Planctomycetota bacterium]
MNVITISDPQSGSSAKIAVDLGFNCYAFHSMISNDLGVDVLEAADDFPGGAYRPSGRGIPILFPFPNRIANGQYQWNGKSYQIPPERAGHDPNGNAIHGFCLDRAWRVVDEGPSHVTGQFQLSVDAPDRRDLWPADFILEIRYTVKQSSLRADIRIANPSDEPLPWGFGTHPYFQLPLSLDSRAEQCLVEVPCAESWELIDCLPTGRRLPVDEKTDLREGEYFGLAKFDDVLTGLPQNVPEQTMAIWDEPAGLRLVQRCDSLFREIVVYTPPGRSAVCLEPYTCVMNAINLEGGESATGWRTLAPGAELHTWIDIACERIMA